MTGFPISDEVRRHVEGELLDACREFRATAETLSHPKARELMLEKADQLDAEAESLLRDTGLRS
jgi:hypothetical protein